MRTTRADKLRKSRINGFTKPLAAFSILKQFLLLVLTLIWMSPLAIAQQPKLQLEVIDPYIELHTGPGIGYPIFYTIEQGESITVLTRRTGWYEVKSENSRVGWARAAQVARTLLPTGTPVELPSVSYGDYLTNSWLVGFNVGQFSSGELEGADTFSFSVGYRPLEWLGLEIDNGEFYDSQVKGNFYSFNFLVEPFSEWQLSPVLTLGSGQLEIESQPELTPLSTGKEGFNRYGLGANYYIGRNFVIHAGFQNFVISTTNDDERINRWNIGFNAFF